jgi:hypothetical protein
MTQQPRNKQPKKKKKAHDSAWAGVFVLLILVVGTLFSLYDGGVFDREEQAATPGLFGTRGAQQLVSRLSTATQQQRICYGWQIDTGLIASSQYAGAPAPPRLGLDLGSNLGAGIDPRTRPQECPRWVMFTADYSYSSSDDEWTSVRPGIATNLAVPLGVNDLTTAGIVQSELLGDQANARLADAIGALPMIVAEKGAARPVPYAAAANVPAGTEPSAPGKGRYVAMGVAVLLILGGLAWIVATAVRSRRSA